MQDTEIDKNVVHQKKPKKKKVKYTQCYKPLVTLSFQHLSPLVTPTHPILCVLTNYSTVCARQLADCNTQTLGYFFFFLKLMKDDTAVMA